MDANPFYPEEDEDGLEKELENDGDIPGTGEDELEDPAKDEEYQFVDKHYREAHQMQHHIEETPAPQRNFDKY